MNVTASEIAIDPNTDMPVVPVGYRWLVSIKRSAYEQWPYLSVSLQKKRWLFWRTVASSTFDLGWSSPDDDYQAGLKTAKITEHSGWDYFLVAPSEHPQIILDRAKRVLEKYESLLVRDSWYAPNRRTPSRKYTPKKLKK